MMYIILGTVFVIIGCKIMFASFYTIQLYSYPVFALWWIGGNVCALTGVYLLSGLYRWIVFTIGFLANAFALEFHKHLFMFNFQPAYTDVKFSVKGWELQEDNFNDKTFFYRIKKVHT